MGFWVLPKGVDVSGMILERGFDGSLKSSRKGLEIGGSKESCARTRRVEFEVILLEVCVT